MKFNLENALVALGWNLGLIAVFSAVLSLFGVDLEVVLAIAGAMIGLQLLIGLGVDVLKWAGVIKDGTAGKWSAALNLLGLAFIAVTLAVNPLFDFAALDAQLVDIAKFLTLIFGYIVQIAGTKRVHQFNAYGLGVKVFSNKAKPILA
jgi:hypothetical protein